MDQKPRHWNLLIALMPYTAPGSLTVAEPISSLPDWLLPDYVSHCEPALTSQLVQPAACCNLLTIWPRSVHWRSAVVRRP